MNKQNIQIWVMLLYIVNLLLAMSDNYYFYHIATDSHN